MKDNYIYFVEKLQEYIENNVIDIPTANNALNTFIYKSGIDNYIIPDEFLESLNEVSNDIVCIGKIALPEYDLFSEADLGKVNFKGKIKTAVIECRTREGINIPHVHISSKGFLSAICINEAKYFSHNQYTGTFDNPKQCELFDKFMRTNKKESETNWQYCRRIFKEKGAKVVEYQPNYIDLIKGETIHETK